MSSARFVSSVQNHTRRSHTLARAIAESLEPRMLLASTFSEPLSLPAGNGAHTIAAGDFNADGRADLAITNSGDNTVTLLLARPDRQFQSPQTLAAAAGPSNLVAGDFNGDHRQDLAVLCANNTITMLLGQGNGEFRRQDLNGTWNPGNQIFARDMNGDGYDDLITGGYEYYEGGGSSVHPSMIRYGGADGLTSSTRNVGAVEAIADMNGDGRPDLIGGGWYSVSVTLGTPDGSYVPGGTSNGCNWRWGSVAGDFNGDGRIDVLSPTDDGLVLFYGDGSGGFAGGGTLPSGITMEGRATAAADFDRDGKDDVVYTMPDYMGGGPRILYGKDMIPSENPWGQPQAPTESLNALYTLAADFNGDGFPDLARASGDGAVILFNNHSASSTATLFITDDSDMPNDRFVTYPDMAVGDTSLPRTFTLRNDGAAPLQISNLSLSGDNAAEFQMMAFGDSGIITTPNFTLAPGSSCRLEVQLRPTTHGMKSAQIRFTTNDPNNPDAVLALVGQAAQPFTIPDRGLEAAIRLSLNKPSGSLSRNDMQGLTTLFATGQEIYSLNGLECATNLSALYLSSNKISDLSPLANLNLYYLNVSHNYLDLSGNSASLQLIQQWQSRGVQVDYEPQDTPPAMPLVLSSTNGQLYLKLNGTSLNVYDTADASGTPLLTRQLSSISSITLSASPAADTFILDFSGGSFIPADGLSLQGSTPSPATQDVLRIKGLLPSQSLAIGDSQITVDSANITCSNLQSVQVESGVLASLTLTGSANVRLVPTAQKVLHLNALSLAPTAALDLADNALILSATPQTKQQLLASLSASIKSARGSDAKWTHSGVGSSAANANKHTGLSIMLNDKSGKPILTTFAGQSVTQDDILVKYTWNGDLNLDGVVDAADYFLVDSGFITQQGGYRNGDLNLDGTVDAADYFLIDSAYIAQTAPLATNPPSPLQQLFSTKPLW